MKIKKDASGTILVIVLGFTALYLFLGKDWLLYLAFGVGLLSILSKRLGNLIERFWYGLAKVLGKIIPTFLMAIIFYLFLFPIALVSRVFKKDVLLLSPKHSSYFKEVNKSYNKGDFEKIW